MRIPCKGPFDQPPTSFRCSVHLLKRPFGFTFPFSERKSITGLVFFFVTLPGDLGKWKTVVPSVASVKAFCSMRVLCHGWKQRTPFSCNPNIACTFFQRDMSDLTAVQFRRTLFGYHTELGSKRGRQVGPVGSQTHAASENEVNESKRVGTLDHSNM